MKVTVLVVSLAFLGITSAKSSASKYFINISTQAKPGHIISVLKTGVKHTKSQILPSLIHNEVTNCISLSHNGVLTLKSNVTQFAGKTVPLTVQHQSPEKQWKEEILLKFDKAQWKVQFSAMEYTGNIGENQPTGTPVDNLVEFEESTQTFCKECVLRKELDEANVFNLVQNSQGQVHVLSTQVFDREMKELYSFVVKADCPNGINAYTKVNVVVRDENDNPPEFGMDFYVVDFKSSELTLHKEIIQVQAFDEDLNSDITYSLSKNELFDVHPKLGKITLSHPELLNEGSYEIQAYAQDQDGLTGTPATLHITIDDDPMVIFEEFDLFTEHRIKKRAVLLRDDRSFVVRDNIFGELFSVAPVPPIEGEMYEFVDPVPENLVLDSVSGMVTREINHVWNSSVEQFMVNITFGEETDDMLVIVYIESNLNWESPILTNEPLPLMARVPIWIRPYTTIFTAQAKIVEQYGVDVEYKIESGAEGRFYMESSTGEVKVQDRGEFEEGYIYNLAISAQTVGNARRTDTPAQVVMVQVEDVKPQFYLAPYVINVNETSSQGQVVGQVNAKSFQELALMFSITFDKPSDAQLFTLDANTGSVTLQRELVYIQENRFQFRGTITATEDASGITNPTEMIINLVPQNLHEPFFPANHYVRRGLVEGVPTGTQVVDVLAVDKDPYDLGLMNFTVNDPRFQIISTNGKTGTLETIADLDYDTAGPEHKYEFTIVATDQDPVNPRSGTATVQVYLENDEGDEAPVFYPAEQVVFVTENTQSSIRFIYFVQAYDPDHPISGPLTFAFRPVGDCTGGSATTCDIFDLDQATGSLTLNSDVPQGKDNMVLQLTVSDSSQSTDGNVTMNFVGVNNPPVFPECNQYLYTSTIQEGVEPGFSIINVTAVDNDAGVNGQLQLTLVPDYRYDDYFALNQLTNNIAEIYNLVNFDRENPYNGFVPIGGEIRYKVTVLAEDQGNPTLSTTCFFFVTIGDENDNPPLFDDGVYVINILRTNTDEFIRTFAIDVDQGINAEVEYSINNQPNDCNGSPCFDIDSVTGWIQSVQTIPDTLDEVAFTVRAQDRGIIPLYSDITVIVTFVQDNSDLPPQWNDIGGSRIDDVNNIRIQENSSENTELEVLLQAQQPDGVIGTMTYYLTRGRTPQENYEGDFGYEATGQSMVIFVQKNLEYDRVSKYILKLRASRGAIYQDARLQVYIDDVNDNIPEFQGLDNTGKYPAAVSGQTQIDDTVLTVIAIDLDGVSPNNLVTYRWGGFCPDCVAFKLDVVTGVIQANQTYNRDDQDEFNLLVVAEDGAPSAIRDDGLPNSVTINVIVQVLGTSQGSPSFTDDRYQVDINEGQPLFSVVTRVTAIDPDPEFNYPQYMISEGNEDHLFAVDTTNGTIYNTGYLMYQEQDSFVLRYHVFDGNSISDTLVVINLTSVNIHPPAFVDDIYEYSDHTEETSIANPLTLALASARDPDDTRPVDIVYSIEGDLTQNNDFDIQPDGTVRLLAPGVLDRDYPNGYNNWQFNLVAEDEGSSSESKKGYAVMNIYLKDLNDNAPVFDACCFEGSVPENSDAGTTVMNLVAVDVDEGENGTVTYELLHSPGTPDGTPLFSVSNDGVVTTTTSNSLDREVQDSYEIIVRARDNGVEPNYSADNQTIFITVTDVNDNLPAFVNPPYAISMPEEIPVGGSVVDILGEDLDIGNNSKLTFEIVSGDDNGNFYFDSIYVGKSGVLKIADRVDFESMPNPNFALQISVEDPDNEGSNSPTDLLITVVNINDNAPVITPPEFITAFDENVPIGHPITTFTAVDPDGGGDCNFTIDYENTDPEKKFAIDPNSGIVTTRNLLDREQQETYEVNVLATDQGEPPMTGTATLFITLNDINDNAPNFNPAQPPVIVGANTRLGDEVVRFTAIDIDTVENGPPFNYDYDCNDVQCQDFDFEFITDNNGTGILKANVDGYNRNNLGRKFYELGISMRDNPTSGQAPMTATRILTVTIESLNDNPMQEEGSVKDVVAYNYDQEFDDVPCGNVYVNDPDDWDLPDKTFTCVGGCTETVEGTTYVYFLVSSDLGELTMNAGTPRGMHTLSIEVFDQKWVQTITATVNVNVKYIYGDAVLSSGSMRLSETSGADLIRRSGSPSKLELLKTKLASLLGVPEGNVHIFSVLDEPGNVVDLQFAAHGSPYYTPARMNGLVMANKAEIENEVGISIDMSPVDLCFVETCFSSGCDNRFVTYTEPALVNTNTTAFVGVNTTYDYACECKSQDYNEAPPVCGAYSCYNDGQCVETWNGFSCNCLPDFDGPRCQSTHLNLDGNSWAWFETLGASQCGNSRLSFDFVTTQGTGLFLYNGPLGNPDQQMGVTDFLAIWLDNGYVKARVNLGDIDANLEVSDTTGAVAQLNDGIWHTVEFIREMQTLRLIVDHCSGSTIDENINETAEDRGSCESRVEYTGEMFLLNVLSPLELGGRSDESYPQNLPTEGFNGCIKNVMYDDHLYDLTVSRTQTSGSPTNICTREQGCAVDGTCPINSTCIGNFNNVDKQCICDSGWRGDNCDIETTTKDIEADTGFIEWALKPDFNNTVLSARAIEIQLEYRSRQEDGMLFTASSFSKLEHLKLDLVETHLRLRYDLGSDERDLWLSYVNASDGLWHIVTITRYGNQMILKMDHGEGKYYNQSFPTEEHKLMHINDTEQTFGGAEVNYKKYVTDPIVTDVLVSSCVTDIRVDNVWFAMTPSENDLSEAAIVVKDPDTIDTCESNGCDGVTCPAGQFCEDKWRMPLCVCPFGEVFENGVCVPVTDCSIPRCNHGYCVVYEDNWRCICDDGWSGESCNNPGELTMPYVVSITEGAIAAILLCLLILLLLILIVIFCVLRKTQKDPLLVDPDGDIRENIVYYDEEGAGEEDMNAYDLSRLQKPTGPREVVMVSGKPNEAVPYHDMQPLSTAPEPMHDPRPPFPLGKQPDVGNFIGYRLEDADDDPNAPPYDSVREYEYEGNGSTAGSLSSIQTSSSGDLDFYYLNDLGPSFNKLADMYGVSPGTEED